MDIWDKQPCDVGQGRHASSPSRVPHPIKRPWSALPSAGHTFVERPNVLTVEGISLAHESFQTSPTFYPPMAFNYYRHNPGWGTQQVRRLLPAP